jgi:hypothetical protein
VRQPGKLAPGRFRFALYRLALDATDRLALGSMVPARGARGGRADRSAADSTAGLM